MDSTEKSPSDIASNLLITLSALSASVHETYMQTLLGTSENAKAVNDWMREPQTGDLVMETSTVHHRDRDPYRFGYLVSNVWENVHTDEEWETMKHEYKKGRRPTRRIWRIKLLTDGTDYAWHNAEFIRVPADTQVLWRLRWT